MEKSTVPIAHRSDPNKVNLTKKIDEEEEEAIQNGFVPASEEETNGESYSEPIDQQQGAGTEVTIIDLDGKSEEDEVDSKTGQFRNRFHVQPLFGNLIPTSDEAFIPFYLLPDITAKRLPSELAAQFGLVPPVNGRRLNCGIAARSLRNPKDYTVFSMYVGQGATGDGIRPWKYYYFLPVGISTKECYYERVWRRSQVPINVVFMEEHTQNVEEGILFGIDEEFLNHLTFEPFAVPLRIVLHHQNRLIRLMRIENVELLPNYDEMTIAQTCQSCGKRASSPEQLFHRCSACKWAWYCSKQCQANHYMFHARFCALYQRAGSREAPFIEHLNLETAPRPYEMIIQHDLLTLDVMNSKNSVAQDSTPEDNGLVVRWKDHEGSYLDEVD